MRYAFLIGCSEYEDADIAELRYASHDVESIAHTLVDSCGFETNAIRRFSASEPDVRYRPTYTNILRELARGPRDESAHELDLLVFFFSGHGFHASSTNRDYLVPQDGVAAALENTSLAFDVILSQLYRWRPKCLLLLLDACRATLEGGKNLAVSQYESIALENIAHHGMAVFSSCRPLERSYESPEIRSSLFTKVFCDAVGDPGQCLTIAELDSYLTTALPHLSTVCKTPVQHPYSRIEPLSVAEIKLVSASKELAWRAKLPEVKEIRANRVPRTSKKLSFEDHPLCAIDFGTSVSLAALLDAEGAFLPVPSPAGKIAVPSVVGFTDDFDCLVGWDALSSGQIRPENRVDRIKRLLTHRIVTRINGRYLDPEYIASIVIRSLRLNVEEFSGYPIEHALVAVPANFSIQQTKALARACTLAGFKSLRLIGEPCAAALLLHDSRLSYEMDSRVLVVDLGGGTLDVSLLEVGDGIYEVEAVAGDNELGGLDYDQAIFDHAVKEIQAQLQSQQLQLTPMDLWRVRMEAERAKIALGSSETTSIILPGLDLPQFGLLDVSLSLSQETFRNLVRPLDQRVEECISHVLRDANVKASDVAVVLLTGQGSKIVSVEAAIRRVVGEVPLEGRFQENAVARGLAKYTGTLSGRDKHLLLLDANYTGLAIMGKDIQMGARPQQANELDFVISSEQESNISPYPILPQGSTIPTFHSKRIKIHQHLGRGAVLKIVEISNSHALRLHDVAQFVLPFYQDADWIELAVDADALRTLTLWIKIPWRHEIRGFQLNHLFTEPTIKRPMEASVHGVGMDIRGCSVSSILKVVDSSVPITITP